MPYLFVKCSEFERLLPLTLKIFIHRLTLLPELRSGLSSRSEIALFNLRELRSQGARFEETNCKVWGDELQGLGRRTARFEETDCKI